MKNELENILLTLLPEHIRDNNPVVTELFTIFLNYIDETTNSKISNLSNLVTSIQEEETQKYTNFRYKETVERKNIDLKMAFINLFASNMNEFFDAIRNDKEIDAKLTQYAKLLGLEKSSLYDMTKLDVQIDEEIISASKSFAQLKGTNVPFDFLANIAENDQLDPGIVPIGDIVVEDFIDYNTQKPVPLKYTVESSMHNIVFNKAFKPAVHPVGFDVIYTRILKLLLEDHFNLKIENYGFQVTVKQKAGKTYKWADELDTKGNVKNKVIKTFKSYINEYNIEELDIRFQTGERLYRISNGDMIYYDKTRIPHKWPKKFYDLDYTFKKRITPLTRDIKLDTHITYSNDEYEVTYDKTNPEIIIRKPVSDFYYLLDHVYEEKFLYDVQTYIEPFGSNDDKDMGLEEFPRSEENRGMETSKVVYMNNPNIIGDYTMEGTHQISDTLGVMLSEDEDLFWVSTDYYVKYYLRILKETQIDLEYNQDLYYTYSTREGRRRIGKWKGNSDPRKESDCRDVPMLTGGALRSKIRSLSSDINRDKLAIKNIEKELDKVLKSREIFYFVIEFPPMFDEFDMQDDSSTSITRYTQDEYIVTEKTDVISITFDMSNSDGLKVGSDGIGNKPLGYEDSVDVDEKSGIFSYRYDGSKYTLFDVLSFDGDFITLESDIIMDYQSNIEKLDDDIVDCERRILAVNSFWGFAQRASIRLERDELIKAKEANQKELDIILDKYK